MAGCSSDDAPAAQAGANTAGDGGSAGVAGAGGSRQPGDRDAGEQGGARTGGGGQGGDVAPPSGDASAFPAGDASAPPSDAPIDATSTAVEAGSSRPGVFVAVGYGGRTIRSIDDGRTWVDDVSLAAKGGDDDQLLRTVLWGNGQFVALGWRVLTSPSGQGWKAQGSVMSQWIGAAIYAKGTYVAMGGYGLRSTSVDGITWRPHAIDQVASHEHGALAFGEVQGGRFVAANDDGRRSYAADGTDWKYSAGASGVKTTLLAFGKGVFVGIGDDLVVLSSDGGSSWTLGPKLAAPVLGLVFAEDHFTAVGQNHVLTSSDGASWQDQASSTVGGALAYGHGTYVMVRDNSIWRSSDGRTWGAASATGGANAYEWVAFGTP